MTWSRPRLLITGASGFLGGWLVALARPRWQVHAVWRRTLFKLDDTRWHRCDLRDEDAVKRLFREVKPDAVIHAAAEANLDWCEDHPNEAWTINVASSHLLAELATQNGARFIFVSSDMVFDGERGDYTEEDPVHPISVYGQTKAQAEERVLEAAPESAVARTALIFGKPLLGGTSFSEWIEWGVREGKNVPLFTDQYRTPILVQNLAEALLELASNRFSGILHLAGPEKVDRYTFGLRLAQTLNLPTQNLRPAKLQDVHFRAARPRDLSLSVTRARRVLRTRFLDINAAFNRLLRELPPGHYPR